MFSPCYAALMRYQIWRTTGAFAHAVYVMIVADPPEGPESNWMTHVPELIRGLGFWTGYKGGEMKHLKPLYRRALAEQGFMVLGGLEKAANVEMAAPGRSGTKRY